MPTTGGSGGALTDRTLQSFTGAGLTGQYHIYAAGIDTGQPVGLMVQFHGDGAYEFDNPTDAYSLGGPYGIIAAARSRNIILLAAKTPDVVAPLTWWENGSNNADYAQALIQLVYSQYDIDTARVWLNGYSGGSNFIGGYLLPKHGTSLLAPGAGAIMFGGASSPFVTVAPFSQTLKDNFHLHYYTGAQDTAANSSEGYEALGDAVASAAYYRGQGFTVTETYPAGIDHDLDFRFGAVTAYILDEATRGATALSTTYTFNAGTEYSSGTWVRDTGKAHSGSASLRSPVTANGAASDATFAVPAGAVAVRFWYQTSTEEWSDFLQIVINGEAGNVSMAGIDSYGWVESAPYLLNGATTVTFRYLKDASVTAGTDQVWIDDVAFEFVDEIPDPELVATYTVPGSVTAAAPLTTPTFTPAADEVLVVKAVGAHSPITIGEPTGGGLIYTTHAISTTTSYCPARLATAAVGASPAAMAVTVPFTGGAYETNLVVERWANVRVASSPGLNTARTGTTTTAMSAAVPVAEAGGVVTWLGADWQPVTTGTPTYRSGGVSNAVRRTAYANYWSVHQTSAAAGSQTIGMTAPTGQKWTMLGLELLPAGEAPPPEVDPGTTASIVDTFSGGVLHSRWTVSGAALAANALHVNAHSTAGVAVYSSARTSGIYTFAGSQLLFEASAMPRGGGSVNAQAWVQDPNPAATVDRIGFEYVGEQNRLDFIGQTGAAYTPIGATASVTYDPVAHRWMRISHSGTSILWATSPDGRTWTTRRSLNSPPTWTTKATLQVSFEAFRSTGVNDVLRIDNVNAAPSAPATTAPSGVDALQRRTLAELDTWKAWLTANSAHGWVGEFGGVTSAGYNGNPTEQASWDALLDTYLTGADAAGLSTSAWSSGRTFDRIYVLGIHVATAVGGALSHAQANASSVVAGHRTHVNGSVTHWRGVNLSGWEYGVEINGAGTVRSTAGFLHTAADFAFLAANGVDTVRLPLAWERVQPTLSAALDATALTNLDGMLTAARQYGIRVVLDLHNYGRYTQANGTTVVALGGSLTNAQFIDFWTRMSTWLKADTFRDQAVIGYALMNEPWNLTGGAATWEAASQAVVTALRGAGDTRRVLVGGYNFSALTEWATWHPDGWITDSANNFLYEAHHYWDTQSVVASRSGTYQQNKVGGGTETLTYANELAAAVTGEGSNTPTVTAAGSFAAFFGV